MVGQADYGNEGVSGRPQEPPGTPSALSLPPPHVQPIESMCCAATRATGTCECGGGTWEALLASRALTCGFASVCLRERWICPPHSHDRGELVVERANAAEVLEGSSTRQSPDLRVCGCAPEMCVGSFRRIRTIVGVAVARTASIHSGATPCGAPDSPMPSPPLSRASAVVPRHCDTRPARTDHFHVCDT